MCTFYRRYLSSFNNRSKNTFAPSTSILCIFIIWHAMKCKDKIHLLAEFKKLPISFVFLVLVKLHCTDNSVKYSLPSFFKSKAKYCTVEYSSWIANIFQYSAYLFTQILYIFILLVFRFFLKQFHIHILVLTDVS